MDGKRKVKNLVLNISSLGKQNESGESLLENKGQKTNHPKAMGSSSHPNSSTSRHGELAWVHSQGYQVFTQKTT